MEQSLSAQNNTSPAKRIKGHNLHETMTGGFGYLRKAAANKYKLIIFVALVTVSALWSVASRRSARTSMSEKEDSYEDRQQQRVVIIAGPQETGTEIVRENIARWCGDFRVGKWTWPVPSFVHEASWSKGKFYVTAHEAYSPLMEGIRRLVWEEDMKQEDRSEIDESLGYMARDVRFSFLTEWLKGRSIVFGADFIDVASSFDEKTDQYVETILAFLPWYNDEYKLRGSLTDTTAVINYRTPRVNHLMALWKKNQVGQETFSKWILRSGKDFIRIVSMPMADMFLVWGVSVAIVDIGGVQDAKLDLTHVIACQIMNAPCEDNVLVNVKSYDYSPFKIENVAEDTEGMDLRPAQLEKIDDVLFEFDCGYKGLMKNKQVTLLYPTHLNENMRSCPKSQADMSVKSMIKEIQNVVR